MRQLNGIALNDDQLIHPLFLNENDYIKIMKGMEKSETEVVPPIDNIRLFEIDYIDLISLLTILTDFSAQIESGKIFFDDVINLTHYVYNRFLPQYAGNNGKAMNMYDICNWYTLPLGFITTGTYTLDNKPLYADVYQSIDNILKAFYYKGVSGDILSIIEASTGLLYGIITITDEDSPNVKILLASFYPDFDYIPTVPTLVFTPEGNRFYFAKPNKGN